MTTNPVDEAREEEIAWLEYFSTELVGMWALMSLAEREHAEVSFLAGYRAAIQQERSRYEGLIRAWASGSVRHIPFDDAPDYCESCLRPWPCPDAALRDVLTPSAPVEKEG